MQTLLRWGLYLMIGLGSVHAQSTTFADAQTRFGLELYQELAGAQPGNLTLSPASLAQALAMTYAGARGQTASDLAAVLHVPHQPATVHHAFAQLRDRLPMTDHGYTLQLTNSLWIDSSLAIQDAFSRTLRETYGAHLQQVNFTGSTENALATINRWVSEQTAQQLPTLLAPGSLPPLTRLVLVNTVSFNGQWATCFDPRDTADRPFHLATGETISIPTMRQLTRLRVASTDGIEAVSLPYDGDRLSMIILIPSAPLINLERNLSLTWLKKIDQQLTEKQVRMDLPRLQLDSDLDLVAALSSLGMADAFTTRANFAGINGNPHDLYLAKTVHQTTIDVNERGTKAAAGSGVVAVTRGRPSYSVIRADRPFLFLIRDQETGALLFLGRVTDPR